MIDKKIKIVGVGGEGRSGKDTLADIFLSDGYYGVSMGDIVREYARKRHAHSKDPISRANTTETSNWLRLTYGPDFVLEEALRRFKEAKVTSEGLLLWSVRAPVEADFIKSHDGVLIFVNTKADIRYERAMQNLREGEPKLSFEDFMLQENLQIKPQPGIPVEVQMDHSYIKNSANIVLENNDSDLNKFVKYCHDLAKNIDKYTGLKDQVTLTV